MEKENILTAKEQEEYKRLTWLEKLGNLIGEKLPDRSQQRLDEYRKRRGENMRNPENNSEWSPEDPEKLRNFREAWKKKIRSIQFRDENNGVVDKIKEKIIKEKIIKAAEQIPVKVETDTDGSRLIEFKLGNKKYKILDPRLENHTDDECRSTPDYDSITHINCDYVKLGGMWGDDVDQWKNDELKSYVKAKERKGLHIAKIEEVRDLLSELGEKAKLDKESAQIAMLMYLTGMDGWYWLSMGDNESSGSKDFRSCLLCYYIHCSFSYSEEDDDNSEEGDSYASLLMMSHEEE